MRLFHGTDDFTATYFMLRGLLDESIAAKQKIGGAPGFFLATDVADAEFFALRQLRGPAAIVIFEISSLALDRLNSVGVMPQAIPRGSRSPWFAGQELHIAPANFGLFSQLLRAGGITVKLGQNSSQWQSIRSNIFASTPNCICGVMRPMPRISHPVWRMMP
jgi:hypothetical protein